MPKSNPKSSLEAAFAEQVKLRTNINSAARRITKILAPLTPAGRQEVLNLVDSALMAESAPVPEGTCPTLFQATPE